MTPMKVRFCYLTKHEKWSLRPTEHGHAGHRMAVGVVVRIGEASPFRNTGIEVESKWKVTWDGFEAAIPTIAAKFEDLRVLRLTMSNSFEFDDLGADRQLFGAFPNLRELTLNVLEDEQVLHFLRAWIDAIMPLEEEEEAAHADSEPLYQEFWPLLELLTVRAPYDNNEDDDQPSLDDSLDLLGSLRLSLGQPFDVWQESIFNNFTVDPLDVD